jgi:hypothetical protein
VLLLLENLTPHQVVGCPPRPQSAPVFNYFRPPGQKLHGSVVKFVTVKSSRTNSVQQPTKCNLLILREISGHENILKRQLVHVGAFNLSLILRQLLGAGTPREWKNRGGVFLLLVYFLLTRREAWNRLYRSRNSMSRAKFLAGPRSRTCRWPCQKSAPYTTGLLGASDITFPNWNELARGETLPLTGQPVPTRFTDSRVLSKSCFRLAHLALKVRDAHYRIKWTSVAHCDGGILCTSGEILIYSFSFSFY